MRFAIPQSIVLNRKCFSHFLKVLDFLKERKFCIFFIHYRNDKFYDPNCMDIVRKTSFGYGTKYDFTKDSSCAPPPNAYNLKDEFSKNIKKGFGFG